STSSDTCQSACGEVFAVLVACFALSVIGRRPAPRTLDAVAVVCALLMPCDLLIVGALLMPCDFLLVVVLSYQQFVGGGGVKACASEVIWFCVLITCFMQCCVV